MCLLTLRVQELECSVPCASGRSIFFDGHQNNVRKLPRGVIRKPTSSDDNAGNILEELVLDYSLEHSILFYDNNVSGVRLNLLSVSMQ
jgi:hypothetical protein